MLPPLFAAYLALRLPTGLALTISGRGCDPAGADHHDHHIQALVMVGGGGARSSSHRRPNPVRAANLMASLL